MSLNKHQVLMLIQNGIEEVAKVTASLVFNNHQAL